MTPDILFEVRNQIGFITLNRPQALNTLTYDMVRLLTTQLRSWATDPSVQGVVVRGAGDRAFCAGGDVRAIYASHHSEENSNEPFFAEEYQLDYFIHRYPKPYIALMDGIVMGGGMGIAQGARLRIVTERTRLAMPETAIGLFLDVGASWFLSRLPGQLGVYLGMTGETLRAPDCLYCGLADIYLAPIDLAELDATLAAIDWTTVRNRDLAAIVSGSGKIQLADPPLQKLRLAIDQHFAWPSVRAIVQSLQKEQRVEYAEWAQRILTVLAKRSPRMLGVTLRQINHARSLSLADCFRMELNLIHQVFRHGEFIEGIRALLVDKDNAPQWTPASVDRLSDEMVAAFFVPAWEAPKHPLADLEQLA